MALEYSGLIETLLKCKDSADKLYGEYSLFRAASGIPKTAIGELEMIKLFLKSRGHCGLSGRQTPSGGSSCFATSLATTLIASRMGIGAKVLFSMNFPYIIHYSVKIDGGQEFHTLGNPVRPVCTFMAKELSPKEVKRHSILIDEPAKATNFRKLGVRHAIAFTARKVRTVRKLQLESQKDRFPEKFVRICKLSNLQRQ